MNAETHADSEPAFSSIFGEFWKDQSLKIIKKCSTVIKFGGFRLQQPTPILDREIVNFRSHFGVILAQKSIKMVFKKWSQTKVPPGSDFY